MHKSSAEKVKPIAYSCRHIGNRQDSCTSKMGSSGRKKLVKRLVLAAAGVIAGLVCAELAVRAAGIAPEVSQIRLGRFRLSTNPKLGYEPVPDLGFYGEKPLFHQYRGKSNRLGFRDVDHELEKPPGVYRILILGDSIAQGLNVKEYHETFPAQLQHTLSRGGFNVEVLNFAVAGYNTQQEVEILKEKGLQYEPNLVLVAYCLNDRWRNDGSILKNLMLKERKTVDTAELGENHLLKSALYRFIRFGIFRSDPRDEEGDKEKAKIFKALGKDTVDQSFRELARLSGEHGFDVLVALFPRFVDNPDEYGDMEKHEKVRGICEELGFRYLDLLETFQKAYRIEGKELWTDSFHPDAKGHRYAALAMGAFIAKKILEQKK